MRNFLTKIKTTLAETFNTPTNCGLIILCSFISVAGLLSAAYECGVMRDDMETLSQDFKDLEERQYDLMEYIILRDLGE
tara:strand:- start:219 stop:455 length:237 start_codon:yes stop_codon:yes gene_type:complete